MIKTFEEFRNDTVNEGLLVTIKTKQQILKVQSLVADEYEKLLNKNPEQFKNGKDVLKAVEDFAQETYKKIVNTKGAITFSQWWKDFEKANSYMLDRTIFNKK